MTQYQFIWNSYKNNICEGFSHLQQHEELVDMTLAAEGYFVKVHKSLLALASPYLKAIIQSAPYQHPIVFLTHIKHKTLGYILEFVYTGEVALPSDDVSNFIEACKSLRITGACDLIPPVKKNNATGRNYFDQNKIQNRIKEKDALEDINEPITAHPGHTVVNISEISDADNFTNNLDHIVPPVIPVTNASMPNIRHIQDVEPQIATKVIEELDPESNTKPEDVKPITYLLDDNDMDIDDENYDDESVSYDNGSHKPSNSLLSASMVNAESNQKNNYSINVEMPDDNEGPPKITIQTRVTENLPNTGDPILRKRQGIDEESNTPANSITIQSVGKEINITSDHVPSEIVQSIGKQMTSVNSTSIPRITIDAGKIQDLPGTSSTKVNDTLPLTSRARTDCHPTKPNSSNLVNKICSSKVLAPSPYYMLSSKGSIQMILNRYLYGLHHHAKQGKKIRWRCIDYRRNRCPAYLDTLGEVIEKRQYTHNHPFHDDKIMNRGSTQKIYESLEDISRVLTKRKESAEHTSKDYLDTMLLVDQ
ncbi:hypothetical protein O0L34_g11405 [Tuta absoluta]|nr:hypothetical protein O0L34_g11405 [Tuta absoluta]